MGNTFLEQIEFLKKRFEVVPLSKADYSENPHLELVQDFEVRPIILPDGRRVVSSLQDYITGQVFYTEEFQQFRGDYLLVRKRYFYWQAKESNDADRNRIFLVIDKERQEVAFYFGLTNGQITDIPERSGTRAEETLVDTFLDVNKIKDEKQRRALSIELYKSVRNMFDAKEAKRIEHIANDKYKMKQERKATGEHEDEVTLRKETFPAVELTHFVRNINYKMPEEIDEFSLGEFVFWELILERIRIIKEQTGLQYMYLFAADPDLEGDPMEEQRMDDDVNKGNMTEEEAEEFRNRITGKLVSYYRNTFGFRIIEGKQLIKPAYDYNCYSMFTSLAQLYEVKALYWDSLDTTKKRRRPTKKQVRK